MFNSKMPSAQELPTTRQLLKSTGIAAVVAVVLLICTVLPAEYGIDLIGAGKMLGLTEMGKVKTALAKEAVSEERPIVQVSQPVALAPVQAGQSNKKNEETITLNPGEAIEIKLEMVKGAKVNYEWVVAGGKVNFDTHGDPYDNPNAYHSYSKGKMAEKDKGLLTAAFDGFHGWFWRNRDKSPVNVTLITSGEYLSLKHIKK